MVPAESITIVAGMRPETSVGAVVNETVLEAAPKSAPVPAERNARTEPPSTLPPSRAANESVAFWAELSTRIVLPPQKLLSVPKASLEAADALAMNRSVPLVRFSGLVPPRRLTTLEPELSRTSESPEKTSTDFVLAPTAPAPPNTIDPPPP